MTEWDNLDKDLDLCVDFRLGRFSSEWGRIGHENDDDRWRDLIDDDAEIWLIFKSSSTNESSGDDDGKDVGDNSLVGGTDQSDKEDEWRLESNACFESLRVSWWEWSRIGGGGVRG